MIWSGMFILDPDPGSGSWFFTHSGSRIQRSKRHRIPDPGDEKAQDVPDPDPQHCTVIYVRQWTVARINTELWILHWASPPHEQPGQPPAGDHPLEQHQSAAVCLGEQQQPASAAGHGGQKQQDWPRPASPGRSLLALLLWSRKDP